MKSILFPTYLKKIAIVLAVLSFLFIVINHFNSNLIQSDEQFIVWIFKDILLILLLIIAFAKDNNESKELNELKFKALKNAFLVGAGIWVFESIMELAFSKGDMDMKSSYEILVIILVLYFINFYWSKANQDENEKV